MLKIKSLNDHEYIYDAQYNLIVPQILYDADALKKMSKQYYTKYDEIPEEKFLNDIHYQQLMGLCIILTDQCNFRCKYCINSDVYQYSKGYKNNHISFDYIDKALKLYVDNYKSTLLVNPKNRFCISFYGGEPLLEYKTIKYVVEQVRKVYRIEEAFYSITTNGYILNDEMIEYFNDNNFWVNISLDGYKEINDRNRVTIDGKGTFDVVVGNILKGKDRLIKGRLGILLTLDYQVSPRKLYSFFQSNPELDSLIVRVNSVSGVNTDYYLNNRIFKNYMQEVEELFYLYLKNTDCVFLKSFFESKFLNISNRLHLTDNVLSICNPLNGKLTVAVDGSLHICEKINANYPIGHVNFGINRDIAYKYYKELIQLRKSKCQFCEIRGLCSICYAAINGGGDGFNLDDCFCESQMEEAKLWLSYYCTSLEYKNKKEFC